MTTQATFQVSAVGISVAATCPPAAAGIAVAAIGVGIAVGLCWGICSLFADDDDS